MRCRWVCCTHGGCSVGMAWSGRSALQPLLRFSHPLADATSSPRPFPRPPPAQSITALAHLRAAVLYVVDISEQCGYTIAQQVSGGRANQQPGGRAREQGAPSCVQLWVGQGRQHACNATIHRLTYHPLTHPPTLPTTALQATLFHSIKPLFSNKPILIVANKTDVVTLDQLSGQSHCCCCGGAARPCLRTRARRGRRQPRPSPAQQSPPSSNSPVLRLQPHPTPTRSRRPRTGG